MGYVYAALPHTEAFANRFIPFLNKLLFTGAAAYKILNNKS
jgi:hypothetical protein